MRNLLNDVIAKLQLDKNSIVQERLDDDGRYWSIEGENESNGIYERYIVYDCSETGDEFDFSSYDEKVRDEEGVAHLIMVFPNWDKEWELRQKACNSLKKATDKKRLLNWFEKKIAFYTELKDCVELEVEGCGENYLEYLPESSITYDGEVKRLLGRSYNISFRELKKIFNVTGKDLFSRNVRFGLRNNGTGNLLQIKFKEYIKIGAYLEWRTEYPEDNDEELRKIFQIERNYDMQIPQNFWFYHNGITIFYYGEEEIDFSGNHIKFNPKDVSVINGAQTLTNFFEGIKRLPDEFSANCANLLEEQKDIEKYVSFFDRYVEGADAKIEVKTVFIEGPEEYVQPITYGLNTQIPILETDIIADSDEVGEINKALLKRGMKIIKAGEVETIGSGFSVLEFVKYYLVQQGKPGESKNLQRKNVEIYIRQAKSDFGGSKVEKLLDDISDICVIEEWWKKSKKIREENYAEEGQKIYNNNAKNYFESFVLGEKGEGAKAIALDDDYLFLLYDKFIEEFLKLEPRPEAKTFKSNELYEKYCRFSYTFDKNSGSGIVIDQKECEGLKEYINEKSPSPYIVQKTVREYLNSIKKDIPYFRVIARTDAKVREAFPFPSSAFGELYQDKSIEEAKTEYLEFEDSCFCKEIEKEFPVFVIDWKAGKEKNIRIAERVTFLEKFSFKVYENQAKEVYDRTIKAFKDGDESEFPKLGDDLAFHVRPKAANMEDSFEFTNGQQITKRTFWANKSTLNVLIGKYNERLVK